MSKRTTRRGGFLGQLMKQAIVPFSILGMQQTYKRRKHVGKKTHRRGKRHSRSNRRRR